VNKYQKKIIFNIKKKKKKIKLIKKKKKKKRKKKKKKKKKKKTPISSELLSKSNSLWCEGWARNHDIN